MTFGYQKIRMDFYVTLMSMLSLDCICDDQEETRGSPESKDGVTTKHNAAADGTFLHQQ
jgi:hypothetical protein